MGIAAGEIAAKLGISEKLVDQAKRVHSFFAKNPGARTIQEPLILVGELPLHKAGGGTNGGKAPGRIPILIIEARLKKFPLSFKGWSSLTRDDKERAKNQLATALSKLPKDIQETAYEVLEIALGK